jgi:putative Mg2+ transporter-C (MgtC) family protein
VPIPWPQILLHLAAALVAGGAIGMERTFHGRPAGFRTHALVCVASSLLMILAVYQAAWFRADPNTVRIDPTRMAQGIMTGIGFLGAGVIFKEGLTVRGLTTAASIWITAAIGILCGAGLWLAAAMGATLTLGVLSAFRRIEELMPAHVYAHLSVRFSRGEPVSEMQLLALLGEHGFTPSDLSYRLLEGGTFEYAMSLRTSAQRNVARLAEALGSLPNVTGFAIAPAGR